MMRKVEYFTTIEQTDKVIFGIDVKAMTKEQYDMQRKSILCKRSRFWSNKSFVLFRCTGKVVKTTLQGRGSIAFAFKIDTSNKNHKEMSSRLQPYIASILLPKTKITVLTIAMKKKSRDGKYL